MKESGAPCMIGAEKQGIARGRELGCSTDEARLLGLGVRYAF